MNSSAWINNQNDGGIEYSLQINEIPWKFKKVLEQAMNGWSRVSYGWNIKTGNQIFIYRKIFKSEDEWVKWAKAFPLEVSEKRWWGNKEKVITYKKER